MADNLTQARRIVGQFLAQNRGAIQTMGAVERLSADVHRVVRGTPLALSVEPILQRLDTVGDDPTAIGYARQLLGIFNRDTMRRKTVIAAAKAVGAPRTNSRNDPANIFAVISKLKSAQRVLRNKIDGGGGDMQLMFVQGIADFLRSNSTNGVIADVGGDLKTRARSAAGLITSGLAEKDPAAANRSIQQALGEVNTLVNRLSALAGKS